jgi:hypothetical protein
MSQQTNGTRSEMLSVIVVYQMDLAGEIPHHLQVARLRLSLWSAFVFQNTGGKLLMAMGRQKLDLALLANLGQPLEFRALNTPSTSDSTAS